MIVIQHGDGWSCSNDASINSEKIAIKDDKGKIKSFSLKQYCSFKSPFTVSGKLEGKVNFAIKDDVTDEVSAFSGVLSSNNKIVDLQPLDNKDFLVYL